MPLLITNGLGNQVTAGSDLTAISATAITSTSIEILFSTSISLSGGALLPSTYAISSESGIPVHATALSYENDTITLTTSEHTNGVTYTVTLPEVGIIAGTGRILGGPFDLDYVAIGSAPSVLMTRSVDARTMEVIFSEPVVELDALNVANYSVNNGLSVVGSSKITNIIYRLTTSKQVPGVEYTVTISNIRDLASNS